MKVIVFTGDNGNACVLTPAYPDGISSEQEADILARCQQNDVPPNADGTRRESFIMDSDSRDVVRMGMFFNSWRVSPIGSIYWDVDSAREIKRNQFRAMRKPILEALDVKFMRAMETGDTVAASMVAARKHELRNVTLIDLSSYDTPEALDKFIPEVLK